MTAHAETDKAALFEAMARTYYDTDCVESWIAMYSSKAVHAKNLDRMRALYEGRIAPESDADRAALSLLQPAPDDSEPVTPEDAALMAVCPTCGGDGEIYADRIDLNGYHRFGMERCPPAPDGCNGTGRRSGRAIVEASK